MDKKNIKIILFLIFALPFGSLYSQTAYQLHLDSIFNIPSNKITTGILIDRTPPVIDMLKTSK